MIRILTIALLKAHLSPSPAPFQGTNYTSNNQCAEVLSPHNTALTTITTTETREEEGAEGGAEEEEDEGLSNMAVDEEVRVIIDSHTVHSIRTKHSSNLPL